VLTKGSGIVAALALTLTLVGPRVSVTVADGNRATGVHTLRDIATRTHCVVEHRWTADWTPMLVSDHDITATLSCEGRSVDLWVAEYANQTKDREALGYVNRVIPREWRRSVDVSTRKAADSMLVNEAVLRRADNSTIVVWYWYIVGNHATESRTRAKVREVLNAMMLSPAVTRIAVVSARASTEREARDALSSNARSITAWLEMPG
jgi:EpsI family protein